jgi:hypothetical protein
MVMVSPIYNWELHPKDTKTFGTNKGFYLLICQFPKNCLLRINQLYIMGLPYMSVPS